MSQYLLCGISYCTQKVLCNFNPDTDHEANLTMTLILVLTLALALTLAQTLTMTFSSDLSTNTSLEFWALARFSYVALTLILTSILNCP